MPLNIKDDFVHDQAKQIAALTGESLTQVVRQALIDRLSAINKRPKTIKRTAENLLALAKVHAENMQPDNHSFNHADLYGDNGLPK